MDNFSMDVACCASADCGEALASAFANCSMCHMDFCDTCTSSGVFCHACLQATFMTREPPLPNPVKTAELLAPESTAHLVRLLEEYKTALSAANERIRDLESQLLMGPMNLRSVASSPEPLPFPDSSSLLTNAELHATKPVVGNEEPFSNIDCDYSTGEARVYLREQDLTHEDALYIAQYLADNNSVTLVDLSDNRISNAGSAAIASSLRNNKAVQRLVFYNNGIEDEGAVALAEALGVNSTLQVVELSENAIKDTGGMAVANALKVNNSVTDLGLSVNGLTDTAATALAAALKQNHSLATLALDYNKIGNEGAKELALALHGNPSITEVNLSNNLIGDEGKSMLAMVANARPALRLTF